MEKNIFFPVADKTASDWSLMANLYARTICAFRELHFLGFDNIYNVSDSWKHDNRLKSMVNLCQYKVLLLSVAVSTRYVPSADVPKNAI